MKAIYRFLLIPLTLLLFFASFVSFAQAQTYTQANPYLMPNVSSDVPKNLNTLTQSIVLNLLSTSVCYLTGIDFTTKNHKCLGWNSQTKQIGYVDSNGGAIGVMGTMIAMTYHPPFHTSDYFAYISGSFHPFGQQVLAAPTGNTGIGFQGLNPIAKVWILFRNIAYLLIVVVFIFVGLGIMLRIKIDPRTVMTVQNSIPKIIIGLIAITLSFAIAGFLIDMMYVSTFLTLNLISSATGDTATNINTIIQQTNPYDGVVQILNTVHTTGGEAMFPNGQWWEIVPTISQTITTVVSQALYGVPVVGFVLRVVEVLMLVVCWIAHIGDLGGLGGCADTPGGNYIVGAIVSIVMFIALFMSLFRLWISLVSSYLNILFTSSLGPLRILMGIIPGAPGGGLIGYIKDLVANLGVFTISVSYLCLVSKFAELVQNAPDTTFQGIWVPGLAIGPALIYVGFLTVNQVNASWKEAMKSKDVFTAAIGQAVGGGFRTGMKGVRATVAGFGKVPQPGHAGGFHAAFRELQ